MDPEPIASSPIDPARFEPAMPEHVREVIAQARRGEGVAAQWLARTSRAGWGRVGDCFLLLGHKSNVSSEIVGWIVGITMFDDERQRLAMVLQRPSHRDNAIPYVLEAFAAGLRAGVAASARHWTSIEALAGRIVDLPPRLTQVLPIGLCSKLALARGSALRLAQRLGGPAREAIEGARARAAPAEAKELETVLAMLSDEVAMPPASEHAPLLEQLLLEWRATHDPALEELIVRLGAEVGRARGEVVAKSKTELEGAWIALAARRDPADLPRLLDAPWPPFWKHALVRVQALATFPADPRISLRLAEIARVHTSHASRALHVAIAEVIARVPVVGALASIDVVEAARPNTSTRMIYARARQAIEGLAITPANPELLEAARRVSDPTDLRALYAEHAANPGDLAARAVLADALQVAGDPRGELIALQLAIAAGTADAKIERRAAALLAVHGDAWTGPLPGVEAGWRRFERGFLVAATTFAQPDALARSIERPEWITVEELNVPTGLHDLAPLIRRMPLLRRLAANAPSLDRLLATAPHRGIRAVFCEQGWLPPAGAFPDLEVLGGGWCSSTWSRDRFHTVQRAARELGVGAIVHLTFPREHLSIAVQASSAGPPETRFACNRWRSSFDPRGWRIRVRRDSPIVEVAVNDRSEVELADELFAALAAGGRSRFALHLGGELSAERARFETPRPGIEIVPGEPFELDAPV
jgi:uncharacterized protein (TIGR02996 family)